MGAEAPELEIRTLGAGDLRALLELYESLHRADEPLPERHELERRWDDICSNPALIYMGGFRDGALVSSCTAAVVPNLTRGARPWAVIENVVTRHDLRGQGLGSRVLQALLDRCWAAGCYKVMLQSAADREAAHRFYEANGFDPGAKQAFIIRK
jgi:GNAT superfamily N-acetyltransferase